ncbi:MAG TPA: glycosyltransferase [Rectinemataceae bacterium]|nr:glycosyltransferase [Rectinemataceae bacterium]
MSLAAIVTAYAMITAAAGIYILIVTGLNTAWMFHTNIGSPKKSGSLVSVLIPARDEEEHIAACLDSLVAQNYENLEIIVYDDDSTDGTKKILNRYVKEYPSLVRAIHGNLEEGWYGKPNALQHLSEAASGAWLYFTDADTVHEADSVGFALGVAEFHKADLLSGYVRNKIGSFGEGQVVPAIYLLTMVAMPLWLIHLTKTPIISHAIGQAMLFRTSMYEKLGGYDAVKDKVSEDVHMARLVKKHGGKVIFADLKDQITCRMYVDYRSAITGFSKNVYDYFNKNIFILVAVTALVPLIFFIPLLASCWLPASLIQAQPWFRLGCVVIFYAWGLVTLERALPLYIPFIYPLILINVLSTAWRARRLFSTGKAIEWKGRMVK